ncbi:hypothetical protein F4802DRAFT_365668 [Xylaria palmicola]|nr:hypothetical protein F4802DRAFT_365668 [Xylaria palmicola]
MSTSTLSAGSHSQDAKVSFAMQPSETSASYFPKGATAATLVSAPSAAISPETPPTTSSSASHYPLSPMDREYMEPVQDLDIEKQLSKQPTYWSVQGWVQRSASSGAHSRAEDPEAKTRKFEEAKRDLLASVGRF